RDFHVTGVQTCALPISRLWMALVTVVRGSPRLSAARLKLLTSTTRTKTCMAWNRSMAFPCQGGLGGRHPRQRRSGQIIQNKWIVFPHSICLFGKEKQTECQPFALQRSKALPPP